MLSSAMRTPSAMTVPPAGPQLTMSKMGLTPAGKEAKEERKESVHLPPVEPFKIHVSDAYDPIPMPMRQQKLRLKRLAEEVLRFNPLEFLKIHRRAMYTIYDPERLDTLGKKMADSYTMLLKRHSEWQPSMQTVPVEKVATQEGEQKQPRTILFEEEVEKLYQLVNRPVRDKIAVCLWSHEEVRYSFWALEAAFFDDQAARIMPDREEDDDGTEEVTDGDTTKLSEKSTSRTGGGLEQPMSERADTITQPPSAWNRFNDKFMLVKKDWLEETEEWKDNEKKLYIKYFERRYEPSRKMPTGWKEPKAAGKKLKEEVDEEPWNPDLGLLTVFPFHIRLWDPARQPQHLMHTTLTFVVGAAWEARALGADCLLTFRLLYWAKKKATWFERQRRNAAVFLLCDEGCQQENNLLLAQCLLDHVINLEHKRITFLGACRLICARKEMSWDNGNMLLFLQRNLLHWAVSAGVLSPSDRRLTNWDNIYECLRLRSKATPATKHFDPHNLPVPRTLWLEERGNDAFNMRNVPSIPASDTAPSRGPVGVWKCDLGRAAPEPWTERGRLGAPEPAKYLNKPAGFLSGWGERPDRQETVDGATTTMATRAQHIRPLTARKGVVQAVEENPSDRKICQLSTLYSSANVRENQKIQQKEASATKDAFCSLRTLKKKIGNLKESGSEFDGFYLGDDIDHFSISETFTFSDWITPRPRHYVWPEEDFSQSGDQAKNEEKLKSRKKKK